MTTKNRFSVIGSAVYGLMALSLLYCGDHRDDCRFGADALFVVSLPSSLFVFPAEFLTRWLPTKVAEAIVGLVLFAAPFLNGWLVGRFFGWAWEELGEVSAAARRNSDLRKSRHGSRQRDD